MAGTAAGTAPFQVTGDRVSAGSAAASNASKHVLAWGNNGNGQLGDGTTTNADVPVKVKLPKGVKVTQLRAGCFHTVAVTSKDHVLAWGDNGNGQLGNGTTVDSTTPVRVRLPRSTKVTAVRAGCQYSLALTSKGHVLAWGYNGFGQLCNGTSTDSDAPVRVRLPKGSKVQILSAGFNFVFASVSGGGLFVWGANNLGQFGDGTTTGSDTPVSIGPMHGGHMHGGPIGHLVSLVAGCGHTLALFSRGAVLAWGGKRSGAAWQRHHHQQRHAGRRPAARRRQGEDDQRQLRRQLRADRQGQRAGLGLQRFRPARRRRRSRGQRYAGQGRRPERMARVSGELRPGRQPRAGHRAQEVIASRKSSKQRPAGDKPR